MIRVLAVLGVLVAFALQVVIWPDLTLRIQPAFLLALAAAWGFATSVQRGFTMAVAAGVILDLYGGAHFGLFTLASLVAYAPLLLYVETRPGELTVPLQMSLFAVSAVVYELTLLSVMTLSSSYFPFFAELLGVATLNVAGTVVVFVIIVGPLTAVIRTFSPYAKRPLQY